MKDRQREIERERERERERETDRQTKSEIKGETADSTGQALSVNPTQRALWVVSEAPHWSVSVREG